MSYIEFNILAAKELVADLERTMSSEELVNFANSINLEDKSYITHCVTSLIFERN